MKIETLNERIARAEEKISKKRATIDKKINWRFAKMAKRDSETDPNEKRWLDCEIENLSDDIDRLVKEVDEAETSLAKYREQLAKEIEKENSRNVKAIIEFLNEWASRVYAYYDKTFPKYLAAKEEYYRKDREYSEKFFHDRRNEELKWEWRELKKDFKGAWNWIAQYETISGEFNGEKLKTDLEQEKKAKYDDIIERTNEVVGTIKDATRLFIGNKGELNGIIVGERGSAKVETISAGGYNIQRFHFRTLIHELK